MAGVDGFLYFLLFLSLVQNVNTFRLFGISYLELQVLHSTENTILFNLYVMDILLLGKSQRDWAGSLKGWM